MEKIIQNYIEKKKLWELIPLKKNYQIYFLAQGEYNKNYVLVDSEHKYVFRVNFGSQICVDSQIDYEFMTLKNLSASGVTPLVFFVDGSKEVLAQGVLVMEYLSGVPLNYLKDLSKAAIIFSKIHSIAFDKNKHQDFILEQNIFSDRLQESQNLLKNIWSATCLTKQVKDIFTKLLNNLEKGKTTEKFFQKDPCYCINNTEVNSHNFIIGKKNSYLVDWEKAVISDPCQDLSHFLAPTTTLWKANYTLSEAETAFFLDCYKKENKFFYKKNIAWRVRLYNPYLYLRALSWCACAYVEYQQSQRNIVNQDTYRKIEQYLEVGFLQNLFKEQLA